MEHIDFLKQIVETPSPTGYEEPVADLVREFASEIADEVATDTMGSVRATLFGAAREVLDEDEAALAAPSCMLAAHMDEVGLMVTYISPEGFLSVASIGGVDAAILPGLRVDVHTAGGTLRGVVGRKPIHLIQADERKNVTPLSDLVIDLGMSADDVKKQVRVGDPITYGVGFEEFGDGMAVSRGFDDKVGVWVGLRVMEELAAAKAAFDSCEETDVDDAAAADDVDVATDVAAGDFTFVATVQEEIGTRGAMTSAFGVNPDVALAFDVTHATDYPGIAKTKYGEITCKQGPVIARGPNINPVVFARLVAAAEAEGIPYQLEAEPAATGTDARAIQVTRAGIPTGLISVPLRYMHTSTEVVALEDLENTVKLITRFVKDLDLDACFVPGIGGAPAVAAGFVEKPADGAADSETADAAGEEPAAAEE